jgi:hypothetical protein
VDDDDVEDDDNNNNNNRVRFEVFTTVLMQMQSSLKACLVGWSVVINVSVDSVSPIRV